MSFMGKKIRFLWLPVFFADFLAIVTAYYATLFLRFHSDLGSKIYGAIPQIISAGQAGSLSTNLENFYIVSAFRIILILVAVICTLYAIQGLYAGRQFILERPVAWNVFVANIIALGIFYAYWYLQRNVFHPRSLFATLILLNIIFCIIFRQTTSHVMRFIRARFGIDVCRALLVGSGEDAAYISTVLQVVQPHGITLAEKVSPDKKAPFEKQLQTITTAIKKSGADMLICADRELTVPQIMQILQETDKLGIPAKILSEELNILVTQSCLPCDTIHGAPLVHFDYHKNGARLGWFRHGVTTLTAAFSLLILSPLMLIIAAVIRLTSKGPAIFMQERIGVNRKPFLMYKFRSMHNKAEEMQAQVEEFNETDTTLFKIKKDPRITPVGSFMRRFSLDEIPQLLNVVKGDMVIVGPRPLPRRDFENYYEEWHYSRHSGMPGLTCLWQVSGRSHIDFHNMCILDIYYLRNHTWVMDIKIIMRTVKVVLFGTGAY